MVLRERPSCRATSRIGTPSVSTNDGDELHGNHPWARTPRPLTVQPAPRGWVNFSWPRTPRPLGGGSIPGGRRGSVKMATDTEPHGEPEEPHWEPPEEEEAP